MQNKKLNNFKIPMIIKHNEVTLTNHDDEGKWKRWTINKYCVAAIFKLFYFYYNYI